MKGISTIPVASRDVGLVSTVLPRSQTERIGMGIGM